VNFVRHHPPFWWSYHHVPPASVPTSWWTSDHILALANIILAAVALATIFFSYRLGKATDRSVATADKVLLASTMPIVVENSTAPITWANNNQTFIVHTSVRNVGNGPAFLRKAEFVTGRREPDTAITLDHVVIAPGEATTVSYTARQGEPFYTELAQHPTEFAVAVNYDDISGTQRTRTVIRVAIDPSHTSSILSAGLYRCDGNWNRERHPFAGTDVRADG
jgi:hypothetical protein